MRLTEEGKIQRISELSSEDEGSEWIATSEDLKKAVVLGGAGRVTVIDYGTASTIKRCDWPHKPGESLINQWLVETPISGRMFVELLAADDVTRAYLKGMLLDPNTPCERSFVAVEPRDMKEIKASGIAGPADTGSDLIRDAHWAFWKR